MEAKKSKKASIEGLKGIFFECGLIVGLFFMIAAFSWSSSEIASVFPAGNVGIVEPDPDVPITTQDDPPQPQEVLQPIITDEIIIVENSDMTNISMFNPEDFKAPVIEVVYVKPKETKKEEVFEEVYEIITVQEPPTTWDKKDANSFSSWVSSKIVYPQVALENGVQGKVILRFKIGYDGFISNIEVLRGIDPLLDKEAIRVVASSPRWNPGKQNGKPVSVMYTFPVSFVISN